MLRDRTGRPVTLKRLTMEYRIASCKSEEGYAVSVPGLPGCWSQGETEQEAIQNIQDAIRESSAVAQDAPV